MSKKRANGEGSIRKRKDGRWEGRYTAGYDKDGKVITKNVLGKTQAEVKEKLTQDPESFALRFLLKRLQSKASTLERSAECEIDELMAPFCEGTDDPAYLEFEDRTDDLRRDYETDKINCVRFPDGTVVPEYSRLVCEKYLIKDGKVFQKKAGHLGHEKRTKKAKKMRAFMGYPVKKLKVLFGVLQLPFLHEFPCNIPFSCAADPYIAFGRFTYSIFVAP